MQCLCNKITLAINNILQLWHCTNHCGRSDVLAKCTKCFCSWSTAAFFSITEGSEGSSQLYIGSPGVQQVYYYIEWHMMEQNAVLDSQSNNITAFNQHTSALVLYVHVWICNIHFHVPAHMYIQHNTHTHTHTHAHTKSFLFDHQVCTSADKKSDIIVIYLHMLCSCTAHGRTVAN